MSPVSAQATATAITMQSISTLPPELLDHVFYFLRGHREDISSCRLVCKIFKECSSPYLITRVVFAKRLKAINQLQEVLDHPYFSKHVTELIYDASYYDDRLAHDWMGYVNACERAPRYLHDIEWAERNRHDDALIKSLCAGVPGADVEQTDLSFRRFDGGGGMDRYYDHVYGLGCHRTLPDYNRKEKAQDRIWAAQLPKAMLEQVMLKLPSLRNVVLSDWRELARSGESYDESACRLFGNTLAPRLLERGGLELLSELDMLLKAIASNHRIESFSVSSPLHADNGTVQYEHFKETGQTRLVDTTQSLPSIGFLSLQQVLIQGPLDFVHLRRLDLHLNTDDMTAGSFTLKQASEAGLHSALRSMTNLTHLSIGFARPISGSNLEGLTAVGNKLLIGLLSGLHFLNLHSLRLQQLNITVNFLEAFLKLHASTIRSVKLIHCSLDGDTRQLAEWIAANLILDGVSLKSLRGLPDAERTSLTDEEELWLAGRENYVVPDSTPKVVGYSSDGKEYDNDERRPWWTQKLVWN